MIADAAFPVPSALSAADVTQRLAALEQVDIARHIRSAASPLLRAVDHAAARLENRITEYALARQIERAFHSENVAGAMGFIDQLRQEARTGRFSILRARPPRLAMAATTPLRTASLPASRPAPETEAPDWPVPETGSPLLVYVPGGGFMLPPVPRQIEIAGQLAEACGCRAVVPEHRLAPEFPFPQPVWDLVDHYQALLEHGHRADRIIMAGDSAGATLTLSALLEIRARRLPMPAGAMLFSPWTDLAMRGWSYVTKSLSSDSPFRMETAAVAARLYLGDTLPTDPRASPAYAGLAGLPALAVHCSRYDMHFDDAIGLAEKARDAGIPVRMNYWDSPRHHLERFRSRDARASIEIAAGFVRDRLRGAA